MKKLILALSFLVVSLSATDLNLTRMDIESGCISDRTNMRGVSDDTIVSFVLLSSFQINEKDLDKNFLELDGRTLKIKVQKLYNTNEFSILKKTVRKFIKARRTMP